MRGGEEMGRQTKYLTVREAAEAINVSEHTIRRRVESGELPHFRIGRCIRISEDDLMDMLVPSFTPRSVQKNSNNTSRRIITHI